MFITASAPNKRSLGATNGLSQTAVSIARAIGPALSTSLFSYSVEKNLLGGYAVYVIFATLSCFALRLAVCLPEKVWDWEESSPNPNASTWNKTNLLPLRKSLESCELIKNCIFGCSARISTTRGSFSMVSIDMEYTHRYLSHNADYMSKNLRIKFSCGRPSPDTLQALEPFPGQILQR